MNVSLFPWAASGRAIANGRDEGVTKLLFHDSAGAHGYGKILGGGMVGTPAGDLIGEVALAALSVSAGDVTTSATPGKCGMARTPTAPRTLQRSLARIGASAVWRRLSMLL